MLNSAGKALSPERVLAEQIVDALNVLFGAHPGYRAAHAKGMICEGTFRPARAAATLSRAPHLQGGLVPLTVRFSNSSGLPSLADGDPNAGARGMAVRFHLGDGSATDIVAHSYNGFPVRTAEEFLMFVRALAAGGPQLEAFLAAHPQAKRFVEVPKPAPASFVGETYYGVNAFRFTNREGKSRYGRYLLIPLEGERHLETSQAAGLGPNFLFEELAERLARSSPRFQLAIQLASSGDPVDDASSPWPDERPEAELGTIKLTRAVTGGQALERNLVFDPARLVDGIEPSGDPLIAARSVIYDVSARRRGL
jgi:catalase